MRSRSTLFVSHGSALDLILFVALIAADRGDTRLEKTGTPRNY